MNENLLGRIFKINHGGKQSQLVQSDCGNKPASFFYFFLTVIMLTKAIIGAGFFSEKGLKPLLLARVIQAVSRYSTHFSFESADPAREHLEGFSNQYVILS